MKLWIILLIIAGIVALAVLALLLVPTVRWLGAILESRRRNERRERFDQAPKDTQRARREWQAHDQSRSEWQFHRR